MRRYVRLLKLLQRSKTLLVIGHQNADPDAVCSAYAFCRLAHKINRKLSISFTAPNGVSKLSKQILPLLELEVTDHPDFKSMDLIVTVDTNTLQQLGNFKEPLTESAKPLVMIDHHAPHPENVKTATAVICDEKATSTCEMILSMYHECRFPPDKKVSQALLIGLLVETGHMSIATRRTFKSAYELIEAGADPEAAIDVARTTMDDSERIARVKAAQRVRLEHVGRWLVALSEVGSYHASAARGLVALGAHLAVVAGKRNDELTVSLRSTREFVEGTGIHLGSNLAATLGTLMGGMGGGHATAAGANVKGEVNEALRTVLNLVRDLVLRSPKPNTLSETYAAASSQTSVTTQN